jgi:hypothetical protein
VPQGTTTNLNSDTTQAKGVVAVSVDLSMPSAFEVSAPGFKTKVVPVDGKTPVLRVDLEAAASSSTRPSTGKPPADTKKPKCRPGDEDCDPFR